MSPLRHRPEARSRSLSPTILGLVAGLALLAAPTSADALSPIVPQAEAQANEGCCGMDEEHTFRGYTIELWDEAPTIRHGLNRAWSGWVEVAL